MDPNSELPFIGASRHDLVELLVVLFDEIGRSGEPKWVSLEAPMGWGKTRVVQEFYRRIAADRQAIPRYWPSSILSAVANPTAVAVPEGRRKRVFPERYSRAAGALPDWFWWGISCSERAGTPMQAIGHDLRQFDEHAPSLDDAWQKRAPTSRRLREWARRHADVLESGGGDAASVAANAAGTAIPVLGLAVWLGKFMFSASRDATNRTQRRAFPNEIRAHGGDEDGLIADLVAKLTRLAAVMPIVIVVEDLHYADETLVELLARVIAASDARILVVTTIWPGQLDNPSNQVHALLARVSEARRLRITVDAVEGTMPPGVSVTRFEPLSSEDLSALAQHLLPNLDESSRARLAQRWPQPLALEVVATMRTIQASAKRGETLTPQILDRIPREIERLYERAWDELPPAAQIALMLAAISSPQSIAATYALNDTRYDHTAVDTASAFVEHLQEELADLQSDLDHAPHAYAWIRTVDEWLRRFHEPVMRKIAFTKSEEHLSRYEIEPFYEALAEYLLTQEVTDDDIGSHRDRILITLYAEGFLTDPNRALESVLRCVKRNTHSTDAARDTIALVELIESAQTLDQSDVVASLRECKADALTTIGNHDAAVALLREILADAERTLGADHPHTLLVRSGLGVSLISAGGYDEAILHCEAALNDSERILGPDHPHTLTTRSNLATSYGSAGRTNEAITIFAQVSADCVRTLGPDHPHTLTTRGNLATSYASAGRINEAITIEEQLLADRVRTLGPDHTLTTRNNLATSYMSAGRAQEAITILEQVLADSVRTLGPNHPHTLTTRNNLANFYWSAGRTDQAITIFEQVLADCVRTLGADHPDTLSTRNNLATSYMSAGRTQEAITILEQLLADQQRTLGRNHPDTIAVENELSRLRPQ